MPVNDKMHKFQLDNTHLITRNKKYDIGEEMKIYLNDTRGEAYHQEMGRSAPGPSRGVAGDINAGVVRRCWAAGCCCLAP